jgi:hypothetical protein
LRNVRVTARDRAKTLYVEKRRPHAYAPHDVALYGKLLRQARTAASVELAPFAEPTANTGRPRLYFRHDVDTPGCVDMLAKVLDVNLAESVPSPVYVRTDGTEYDPADVADTVAAYRMRGVEFGLHSSCYTQDDCFGALRRETDRFAEHFGFRPRSFTVHGLGEYRYAVRERFSLEIVGRLSEFGFVFTDCSARMRNYDYVITDCHLEPDTGRRLIYDDMLHLPRFFQPRRDYLVLTHPCYWR